MSINLRKFKDLNDEMKMALINESIKKLKNNYYDLIIGILNYVQNLMGQP